MRIVDLYCLEGRTLFRLPISQEHYSCVFRHRSGSPSSHDKVSVSFSLHLRNEIDIITWLEYGTLSLLDHMIETALADDEFSFKWSVFSFSLHHDM